MSSNSLSFTNIKDGIFNNIYLIDEDGGIDDIKDLLSTSSGDLSGIMVELNKKAPKQNPEFTGTVTVPNNSFSQSKVVNLESDLLSKAPTLNPTLSGTVILPGATFYTGFGGPVFDKPVSFTAGVAGLTKSNAGLDYVDNTNDLQKPISNSNFNSFRIKS